jgi:predicted nucleotide-binding protein
MRDHEKKDNSIISPKKGIELLKRQYVKGKQLLTQRPLKPDDYSAWENTTREYLIKAFGATSTNISAVLDIGKYGVFPMSATEKYWEEQRAQNLERQLVMLDSLIELLETEIELQSDAAGSDEQGSSMSNSVFLVHGHNQGIKEAVARFLERLSLQVIILHEKPNAGRTIIEKFVDHSDVGFAVVLLTGDDRGGDTSSPYERQLLRARQNVILELGFFLGKLGRKRVCALYQDGVEIPSDYQGVLFLALDEAGAWRLQLARELKAIGLPVDMNKAF